MKTTTEPALYHLQTVGSTNAWCKERFAGLEDGAAVWADAQTAGRGRLGRAWHSAPGAALYYTVVFKRPFAQPACLPLAVSLETAAALRVEFGAACAVKWPNDLLLGGKKLVGILCEGVPGGIVCGIGVNLRQSRAEFEAAGLPHAASLEAGGIPLPRDAAARLAAVLSARFAPGGPLSAFCESGFAAVREEYRAACVNLGRPVEFEGGRGVAEDVDEEGRLVVRTEEGTASVFTGEVSVRGIYGKV
ncbi:biotin--[acetyl-CoA-carboxylase] ligase [Allofournierella sp.]|uniref:biotin--[acetyl-CoA-carboxylase] ligase n=1 Tax=Allofournierella sp. TaxID=1940256 RepID=UPI003AB283AE